MGRTTPTSAELTPNGIWIETGSGEKFITSNRLSDDLRQELPD